MLLNLGSHIEVYLSQTMTENQTRKMWTYNEKDIEGKEISIISGLTIFDEKHE